MLLQKVLDNQFYESEDGNKVKLNMDCDVVIVSDLHIDVKKDRPLYFWEILRYLDSIADRMEWMMNPVFISLGDIFNKDMNLQKGLLYYEEALKRFKRIQKVCKGRCYAVYGNHEDTNIDVTPSTLFIEPSEHLMNIMQNNKRKEIFRSFGDILKTPEEIRLYDTKITLFHFNKWDKSYKTMTGDCEYHVGLYHDTFVNNTMRNAVDSLPVDLIWKRHLNQLNLNEIDLAIFGDFHIPVPLFQISNRRNTKIIIPGTFGRNNFATETHNFTKLPVLEIRRDNKPKLKVLDFPLIDYTLSYNLSKKMKDLSNITNRVRNLVENVGNHRKQEINLKNFSSFIYSTYGDEWGDKVYFYVREKFGEVLKDEGNNGVEETDFRI